MGEHQAASESMAQAEAMREKLGGHLFMDDWLTAIKVEMALRAGQLDIAMTRAEQAVTFVRSVDGKFAEALVQRAWGEALSALNPPQWEEADAHFSSSLELFDSGGAALEAALVRTGGDRSRPDSSVAIEPASAALAPGETQQFKAAVKGTANQAVTWKVQEAAGGTITPLHSGQWLPQPAPEAVTDEQRHPPGRPPAPGWISPPAPGTSTPSWGWDSSATRSSPRSRRSSGSFIRQSTSVSTADAPNGSSTSRVHIS